MNKILILLFFALSIPAFGQTGNDAYAKGDFVSAAKIWEEELAAKGANASLLYNLGNARYRLGEYGPAIYAYERALILAPRSPDIKANLDLARKAAAAFDESSQSNRLLSFLYWMSYNEWLTFGIAALIALAIISLLRAFDLTRRSPVSLRGFVVALSILLIISVAVVIVRHPELNRAIVVGKQAEVRLSPFPTAEVKATLKSGQSVQIEKEHEGYYRINNGWVSKELVKPLMY